MQTICTAQVQQAQYFMDVFLLGNPAEKEGKPTNYSYWKHTSIFTKLENLEWRTQSQGMLWTIAILWNSSPNEVEIVISCSVVSAVLLNCLQKDVESSAGPKKLTFVKERMAF